MRSHANKPVECEQKETDQIWKQINEASIRKVCGCAKVKVNFNSEWYKWWECRGQAVKSKKWAGWMC